MTFEVPTDKSVVVNWKKVPEHCQRGIIQGYRVSYRRLGNEAPWTTQTVNSTTFTTLIKGLSREASYIIMVNAFTKKGHGNTSMDILLADTKGRTWQDKISAN